MKKILLIEDNEEILDNISEILEMANYAVIRATNGKEGVAMALEHTPDLIVCDIMMPVLDGYGVLHLLQKQPTLQNIPFIFLTSRSERTDIRKGMEMGADDYITKPFEGAELLSAIDSRLKRHTDIRPDISSKDLLESLKDNRNIHHCKKKQTIYNAGQRPIALYYVLNGKVKTYRRNNEGKELITGLYNEGDFFGYYALLEDGCYQEYAEALENASLAVIPREDFEQLTTHSPEVLKQLVQLLTKNMLDKEQQLIGLAYNSLRKKVAEALLMLDKKYNPGSDTAYEIDISRENLAAVAGVAKESLIRTLSDFRDEALIRLREGNILLNDRHKLAGLIN
ncbi:response regulator [Chitinophaga vietnamensis]|uniref:response regulator n=1 Tax=Chitinophaga vietnamensis TaxID=2593957 RepID=UPI00117782DA|nr:response regulator [Chitinophaga vietnamensis]